MQRAAIAAVVFSLFSPGLAAAQATPAVAKLDVSSVRIERTMKDRLENESAPPLSVAGIGFFDDALAPAFASIVDGHPYPGTEAVYGYLGRGYPASGEITAERFERRGAEIRLEFRYRDWKEMPRDEAADGWAGYFLAPLPADLPDGTYRVVVKLHDSPGGTTGRAALEATFAKPDALTKTRAAELAAFDKLPPKDRVARYREVAATTVGGGPHVTWNWSPHSRYHTGKTPRALVEALKRRLIDGKFVVSPYLIEALRDECERDPNLMYGDSMPGTSGELMQMLTAIGDARAAPLLLEIVSGKRTCSYNIRDGALKALEILTCIRFRQGGYGLLAPDVGVSPPQNGTDQQFAFQRSLAPLYEKWLAAHPAAGADRSAWRNWATKEARARLSTRDIDAIYSSILYLRDDDETGTPRDDDPDKTTDQIAAVISEFEPIPASGDPNCPDYRYRPTGRPIPDLLGNWMSLLERTGTVAERNLPMYLGLARDVPTLPASYHGILYHIGGKEAMTQRWASYRKLVAEVRRLGIDLNHKSAVNLPQPAASTLFNVRAARVAIERWAGRVFDTEPELLKWIEVDKDRSQQEWLESGLPILAAQADAGHARAQYLMRVILGDVMPHRPAAEARMSLEYVVFMPLKPETVLPFRVKWLAENRARLRYEPEYARFRLETPAKSKK